MRVVYGAVELWDGAAQAGGVGLHQPGRPKLALFPIVPHMGPWIREDFQGKHSGKATFTPALSLGHHCWVDPLSHRCALVRRHWCGTNDASIHQSRRIQSLCRSSRKRMGGRTDSVDHAGARTPCGSKCSFFPRRLWLAVRFKIALEGRDRRTTRRSVGSICSITGCRQAGGRGVLRHGERRSIRGVRATRKISIGPSGFRSERECLCKPPLPRCNRGD